MHRAIGALPLIGSGIGLQDLHGWWSEHLGLVVAVGCDPFILYCTGSCRLLGLGGPSRTSATDIPSTNLTSHDITVRIWM